MEKTGRRLNIGSGSKPLEGYTNIDLAPHLGIDVMADWLFLPFANESMALVNAGQVLEHFDIVQRGCALKEAWRVLRYGGELHIDVPDIEGCCRIYLEGKRDKAMAGFYGRPWLLGGGHQWGYSEPTLNQLIWDAGFVVKEIEKRYSEEYPTPYLLVEALKVHGIRKWMVE
jgi:predicted SAM-dependent methyltransferase